MENFDKLIFQSLPQGEFKHDFWENALLLDRAQELLKMDVSGKLQHFSYEHEFANQQTRKVKQFEPDKLSWRNQLIHGLGVAQPEIEPSLPQQKHWTPNSLDSFNQQFIQPALDRLIKENVEQQYEEDGQQNQAVQQEAALTQEETELVEENTQVKEDLNEVQGQYLLVEEDTTKADEEASIETSIYTSEESSSTEQGKNPLNINAYSKQYNLNGYDYPAFLNAAKKQLRPKFEQEYENQKEFIKHMLSLEAIAEEARLTDNQTLQKRLSQAEENVKNPITKAKLMRYGLWGFDFVTVTSPEEYSQKADNFRAAFYDFKKYLGLKSPESIPSKSKQLIQNSQDVVFNRQITPMVVEELLLKRRELFLQAEAVIQTPPQTEVEELICWGIFNDQPIAIYLAQKLAMITNQKIAHETALAVSQYLSHQRELPEQRIVKCKEALKIVGRVNRQHIYDFNYDYQHITVRKHFSNFITKRKDELNSSALSYLSNCDPTHSKQDSELNLQGRLKRGPLIV